MIVDKDVWCKYVKFSELNVGDDFMYGNSKTGSVFYFMKTEVSYSDYRTIEYNAVNLETGFMVSFDKDEMVIPMHGVYSSKKEMR